MNSEIDFHTIPPELMPKAEELPGELGEIARVIGVDNTIKLSQAYRGCSVYIRNIDHLLRKMRNTGICNAYDGGEKVVSIARRLSLSTRQIERILQSGK